MCLGFVNILHCWGYFPITMEKMLRKGQLVTLEEQKNEKNKTKLMNKM